MSSVVITGATGFIGRHLTEHLIASGTEVYALTRHPQEEREGFHSLPWDPAAPERTAESLPEGPEAFLHLAWEGVAPEARNSTEAQKKNVELAMSAVRLAAGIKAERFILPGSTMEYAYCGGPVNSQSRPSPQNAYGTAKIAARFLCESLCEESELPFVYVVISGIYGADRRDSNVITYAITELLAGRKPSFTALEQLWDYVHIDDVARALGLIAEKGKAGAFYTVGHGDNWPLARYIYQIRDLIDPTLPLGIGEIPYKNGRLPSSCVDLRAIRADTGFEPQVPFEQGIQEVIEIMRKEMRNDEK